ncbi:MAG TPA: HTH domain-containing protein [Candidatus Binatia bacterium]|nr:HTH domain-containing protein [Candidatus Binatia bacterium]
MADSKQPAPVINTEQIITDILNTIEREREREIISRRFGLFDRRETLEQIGELLGITRERVRQLEKVVINKLRASGESLPHIPEIQATFTQQLHKMGEAARIIDLTSKLIKSSNRLDQSRIAFLAALCPLLTTIEENDLLYLATSVTSVHNEKQLKTDVIKVVDTIKKIGEPSTIEVVAEQASIANPKQAEALASISKQLATLNGRWGLVKWPMVNPKNIRDKIYVVLKENGKQMHFSEIAEAIKKSDFKRKAVTTQAIHNELIKDSRFVLIGRGIYALNEWGYKKGTVADIITEVIKEAGEPLHRDEIVKRVLKSRIVKETTVLLNLQGKSKFKRVAKATYDIADAE